MILLPVLTFAVVIALVGWFAVAVAADRRGLRSDLADGLQQVGRVHLAVVSASERTPKGRQ